MMSWGWNKYRENHQQAQVPPPVAEPVPTQPATPPPQPKTEEKPARYPWETAPDSD